MRVITFSLLGSCLFMAVASADSAPKLRKVIFARKHVFQNPKS
jgi:hypothetical protein